MREVGRVQGTRHNQDRKALPPLSLRDMGRGWYCRSSENQDSRKMADPAGATDLVGNMASTDMPGMGKRGQE